MSAEYPQDTTPGAGPQAPDAVVRAPGFDAEAVAQRRMDFAVSDGWIVPTFAEALERKLIQDLGAAYRQGQRDAHRAAIAEIRRVAGQEHMPSLAVAALRAIADRLEAVQPEEK